MDDFLRAHEGFTAEAEGGYVNDYRDPGGETNRGVTRRVWEAWCREQGLPVKRMRDLTHADVLPLYRARYWNVLSARLPWPLSAAIYDMSVNHGPGDANPYDEKGYESGASWILWRTRQLCPTGTPLQKALAACDARHELYAAIVRRRPLSMVFWYGWMKRLARQRAWIKLNANATTLPAVQEPPFKPAAPGVPRAFYVEKFGKKLTTIEWTGDETLVYGGKTITREFLSSLTRMYPARPYVGRHGLLTVQIYRDGSVKLSK